MEISGRIKLIDVEKQISASFKARDLIITTEEQYPQHVLIQFTQDKCDLLNARKPGELVKVSINLRGREWISPQGETKYFNTIQGWRIEVLGAAPARTENTAQTATNPQQVPQQNEEEHDDLPF